MLIPDFPALVGSACQYIDNTNYLWIGYADNWLKIRAVPGLTEILHLLDGSRSTTDIQQQAKATAPHIGEEQILKLLRSLSTHNLLMTGKQPDQTDNRWQRHSRDLELYALFEQPNSSRYDYLSRLQECTVVILGLGGVGSWTALSLACAGVGTLVGADHDSVELTNLGRQILFYPEDIGVPKTLAVDKFLKSFSTETHFEPVHLKVSQAEDIRPLLNKADFFVLAADWPPRKIGHWVNRMCWEAGIPSITMTANVHKLWIGPLVIPGQTCCRECMVSAARPSDFDPDSIAQQIQHRWEQEPMPAIVSIPAFAGHMLAWEIVSYLTSLRAPQTINQLICLDLESLSITKTPINRNPTCPVCGDASQ